MKKIIIGIVLFVGAIALLPIIGNSMVQKTLKQNIDLFCANGVDIKNETTDSSYLTTKKHYEFILNDASKFVKFINQYSDAQLPPFVEAAIGGVTIGVDVEYNNIPIGSKIVLDIYPTTLPQELQEELKEQNLNFYNYINKLLQTKGVLYHMNYYVSDNSFDGYIKDIDEKYVFANGNEMIFKILDATYYGEGAVIAPKTLHTKVSDIRLDLLDKESDETISFQTKGIEAASIFESQSTYASSVSVKNFSLLTKEQQKKKVEAKIDVLKVNISSNVQGSKAEFYTKMSLKEMNIDTKDLKNLNIQEFNYDISLDGVDKDTYEEFRVLTSHPDASNSADFEKKLQDIVIKLVSKGLSIRVPDLSVKKITINNEKPVDGFSFMATMTLDENPNLQQNLRGSPKEILEHINLASKLKFSKDFLALINNKAPLTGVANSFVKEDGDNLVFDVKLNAGVLSVNDKVIN